MRGAVGISVKELEKEAISKKEQVPEKGGLEHR
jgi:hypothetical protein